MEQYINEFKENGYFRYPAPELQRLAKNTLFQYWKAFCSQSDEEKLRHVFTEEIGGYELKIHPGSEYKENFHVSLAYKIPENASLTSRIFIEHAQEFIKMTPSVVRPMVHVLSKVADTNLFEMVIKNMSTWQLRFLHYFPRPIGMEDAHLANAHVDKGITIHWWEDAPGLQRFWQGDWHDVLAKEGEIHGYFGLLGQYYSKCAFPALNHRVVANKFTARYGRSSIVMFCDFGDVRYDKENRGPTKETFSNGENYTMPFSLFEKFFVPVKS